MSENTEDVLPEVRFSSNFALKLRFGTIMLNNKKREVWIAVNREQCNEESALRRVKTLESKRN